MYNPAMYTPYHEKIARRAHEIWETSGRPEGCEVQHWLQAEKELAGEDETATRNEKRDAAAKTPRRT
jgi:hypothetical protein